MIEKLILPSIDAQRFGKGVEGFNFTHSEKIKAARLAEMYVLEISAKVCNYHTYITNGWF